MRAFGSAVLGLLAIAVTGCGPVFGTETPPWLSNAPVTMGPQAAPNPGLAEPAHLPRASAVPRTSMVELRAPAIIVVRAPGGGPDTIVNVTCTAAPAPEPVSRFRPSPYGD